MLRKCGATVQTLAAIGKGCPDLLVGYKGVNHLVEIKDGQKPPSARTLTEDQAAWHMNWRGGKPVVVLGTEDVFRLLNESTRSS